MFYVIYVTEKRSGVVFPRGVWRVFFQPLGDMTMFWIILVAALVPIVFAVLATEIDEEVAIHGGFHKKHM